MRKIWTFFVLAAVLAVASTKAVDVVVRLRDKDGRSLGTITVEAPPGGTATVEGGDTPAPPAPPPAPKAPKASFFIVIKDETPGKMTPVQLAAIRDPKFRAKVQAAGLWYHEYDVASDEVQKLPPAGLNYAGLLSSTKPPLTAPCILWLAATGHLARSAPLPATPAELSALLP